MHTTAVRVDAQPSHLYLRSKASQVMTAAEERVAFRSLAAQHAAAWTAVLMGGTIADSRADDVDWQSLRDAQAAALKQAARLINARGAVLADQRRLGRAWYRAVVQTRDALADTEKRILGRNLRLAVHVATYAFHRCKLDLDDREQAAARGVMKAIRRFDVERGLKFSTYATWWIRHEIQREEQNTASTIRVAVHMHETARVVHSTAARLLAKGAEPTVEQISALTGRSPEAVEQALTLPRVTSGQRVVRGDQDGGSELVLFDVIPAADPHLDDLIEDEQRAAVLVRALGRLPPQVRAVLEQHHGLGGEPAVACNVIAQRMGCSRQYVQQLEAKGMSTLARMLPQMMSGARK